LAPALQAIVGLWTGCIAGALLDSEYVSKLTSVGFTDASVQITRGYDRSDIEALAAQLSPADIPVRMDIDEAIDSLDGAFASAFIRAVKPS